MRREGVSFYVRLARVSTEIHARSLAVVTGRRRQPPTRLRSPAGIEGIHEPSHPLPFGLRYTADGPLNPNASHPLTQAIPCRTLVGRCPIPCRDQSLRLPHQPHDITISSSWIFFFFSEVVDLHLRSRTPTPPSLLASCNRLTDLFPSSTPAGCDDRCFLAASPWASAWALPHAHVVSDVS